MKLAVVPLTTALILVTSMFAVAQTSEEGDVVHLSAEELGPFRPTERPDVSKTRELIVQRTNAFRQKKDRQPVERDDRLDATAQDFADYMARTDRYGHSADDRHASERAHAHDYSYCLIAENIAYRFHTTGFETRELAKKAVTGWRKSPEHRKNMLRRHVLETGVGVAQSESTGVYYLVQLFGRPRSAAISFDVSNRTDESIEYSLGHRQYELPPRYTRTHELCVPRELRLDAANQDSVAATPTAGDHFVVLLEGDGITFKKRAE